ncbi:MAG: hypothetical protein IJC18_02010 [Clostridia bacterium]|nr:hypothetical protein [Clostridia bacterium]
MGKYARSYFENPYLEDAQERKLSVEVVMDDARQKWRTGSWRARSSSFDLKREQLTETDEKSKESRPSSDRFKLNIKKDLMGDAISLSALSELDYSPSYRPKGNLDEELLVRPMSTLQRYDVLAGELEAPPEDLSFLSDADVRREREGDVRDGKLRRSSRRLERSVDERRSEVIGMIPDLGREKSDKIIAEAKRRRELEDIELGKKKRRRDKKKEEAAYRKGHEEGSRFAKLPMQDGMEESSQELPEFESMTRLWSQIDPEAPWSEVAHNTISTIPEDIDVQRRTPHYSDDDVETPYGRIRARAPRARLRSTTVGKFENEYLREQGVDIDRVRHIMEHKYRGRWIPPEFFADDALVQEWFNQFSRGAIVDEDFVHWAHSQRRMAEQQRITEQQARLQRIQRHQPTSGRRRSPYMQPPAPHAPMPRDHIIGLYDDARELGYQQGADMSQRENERIAKEKKRREREESERQQRQQMPPFGYPYGGYPQYGMPPQGAPNQYHGMYPDLFAGKNSQPEGYRPPDNPMKNYQPEPSPFDERGRRKKQK